MLRVKSKRKRERETVREKGRAGLSLYMLKSKLKIRPGGRGISRACDCWEDSTRREKLFIRCYPLKTFHQIPHVIHKH